MPAGVFYSTKRGDDDGKIVELLGCVMLKEMGIGDEEM